jgi:hypothetical protein
MVGGAVAHRRGAAFVLADGREASARDVRALIQAGVLAGDATACRRTSATSAWLKRARLDVSAFAAQHRITTQKPDGTTINLAESPLARLAAGETAFLEAHQVEAGERVRRLIERAQLQPRVTMSYSAAHISGNSQSKAGDLTDLAADARRAVAEIHHILPRDCAGVVVDVCGLLKGLQEVERDRGWPRRSAKLVLRIGLDQLAQHYGLGPFAIGKPNSRPQQWMEEGARPDRFE